MTRVLFFLAPVVGFLMLACADRDKKGNLLDTPTSGHIKIAADESLKPLVEAEIDTFEGLYKNAHIDVTYMSEPDAVEALLKDSVRMIFITRHLYDAEKNVLKPLNIVARQIFVAKDGIALIVNRENADSLITFGDLQSILSGKVSKWKEINKGGPDGAIDVVFDHPKSGMVRFLNDTVVHMDKLPKNCFAVDSNQAVVEYVAQRKNALGLIGVSWISDSDDATANKFLSTVKVVGMQRYENEYYKPFQAYIATHQYPLRRNVAMVSREPRTGLASGFMSFVASDRGQRIILKLGLVPVTMPVRVVEIKHEPLGIK